MTLEMGIIRIVKIYAIYAVLGQILMFLKHGCGKLNIPELS